MKAKVTHKEGFSIFVKGQTLFFPEGTILEGEYATKAVDARRANEMLTKKKSTKALKGAPENK